MAQKGDRVRYLNATGGGVITRIEGKTAYVDDDGFETPVLLKDLVVVAPAGLEASAGAGHLMFDQKAFDAARNREEAGKSPAKEPAVQAEPEPEPVEETDHGEKLNITLAFEPADLKQLSKTVFNAVLVNNSNYFLKFQFLSRGDGEGGWKTVYEGEVSPNELIDLAQYTHETIGAIGKVALQCIASKKGKAFALKAPLSAVRRVDLTKFHKLHCFRQSVYFDSPVLEFPLVSDDVAVGSTEREADIMREKIGGHGASDEVTAKLAGKYQVERARGKQPKQGESPFKLLPLIEVDLHIGELLDTTAGMDATAIITYQLDTVRKTMKAHCRRTGQKIVFIHGKGEGVLRKAVLKLLRTEYPKCELQDASFQEYGFGATLVTVH